MPEEVFALLQRKTTDTGAPTHREPKEKKRRRISKKAKQPSTPISKPESWKANLYPSSQQLKQEDPKQQSAPFLIHDVEAVQPQQPPPKQDLHLRSQSAGRQAGGLIKKRNFRNKQRTPPKGTPGGLINTLSKHPVL